MAQIINDMDLGSSLGRQLGTGLSRGLSTIAGLKLQDMLRKQREKEAASAFRALGTGEQQAKQLSQFPESVQRELIKGMREFLPYGDLLGRSQPESMISDQMGQLPQYTPEQMISSMEATSPMDQAVSNLMIPTTQQPAPTQPASAPMQLLYQQPQQQYQQQAKPRTLAEVKQAQQLQAIQSKEDIKANRAEWEDIRHKAKVAEESKKRVARMRELVESKQLNRPRVAALVSGLRHGIMGHGIDLSSMLTEGSQEYEKLIQGFLPEAKAMFGARMTDTDLKEFLKGMPDLLKDRNGKRRMLHNMDIMSDTAILRKKVGDMIIRDNGGRIPNDLETRIDERARKQLDALAEKFKQGFRKPIKSQAKEKSLFGRGPGHVLKKLADFTLGKG